MKLYLYFSAETLDSAINIKGFSYTQVYYNNLSTADNYVKCTIPFDTEIANYIKLQINSKIKAVIKNDDNTNYFTGYLKQDATFGKASAVDNISLEIVSPSFYLDKSFDVATYYVNKTLSYCVEQLLSYASVTDFNISNLPSKTVSLVEIEENDKVSDILEELLKEYGYTYDFDADGTFICNPIFNTPSTVTQIFKDSTGGNLLGKVTQKVSAKDYDGVSAQFDTIEYKSDIDILSDTSEKTVNANAYIEDNDNGIYTEYNPDNKTVKYIDSITDWSVKTDIAGEITKSNPITSSLTGEITNYYTQALLKIKNTSSGSITINSISIKGSGYFVTSTGKTKVTNGDNIADVTLKYIYNETDASDYAQKLSNYYRYANFKVSLNSKQDYDYGSFVKVTIEHLGEVTGRIIQKTYSLETSVINYTIESISDYTPATLTTVYQLPSTEFKGYSNHIITLYKKSTTAITSHGITGTALYSFKDNTITWTGSNNGWTDDYSSLSGDGTVYITTATAYGQNESDYINPNEWAEPISQGLNGDNGYNTRTIQLFQRSDASPVNLPFDFTLDFTARNISISTTQLNGWQTSYPAIDEENNPCWEIHVTALSTTTTDTITTSQWSTPAKISQDVEVTKAEIQELINESMQASAPVVYCDTTFGGFAVDTDSVTPVSQSITTAIHVMQSDRELEFQFGTITLPSGFHEAHSGNELTISVDAGTTIKSGTINIPVIYKPYLSTDTYGDESANLYVDEDGNNYGYWILSDDEVTYNLGFGYTQIKGGRYLNNALGLSFNKVADIPSASDTIVGDYFCWCGTNNTTDSKVATALLTGGVYAYNGYQFEKDTTPSHLQGALSDILSNAEADLATNNSDVVGLFQKIVSQEIIAANLTVTGTAFMNNLHAAQIYADEFVSYDNAAKGYADNAESNAVSTVYSDTGLSNLTNKTIISGGYIKTDLINASQITIGQTQVTGLSTALSGKASTTSVDTLTTTVNSKADSSTVSSLQTTVNSKADSSTVTALQTTVNGKADSSTVSALSTKVDGKADSSTVTSLQTTVSNLSTTVSGKADSTVADKTIIATHLVYYQDSNATVSQTFAIPTAWITDNTGNDNIYTLTCPEFSTTVNKTLYTVTQYKLKDGTIGCESSYMTLDRARQRLWAQTSGATLITNGYINTNLIEAESISATMIDTDSVKTELLTADNIHAIDGVFDDITVTNINDVIKLTAGNIPFANISSGVYVLNAQNATLDIETDDYSTSEIYGYIRVIVTISARLNSSSVLGGSKTLNGTLNVSGFKTTISPITVSFSASSSTSSTVLDTVVVMNTSSDVDTSNLKFEFVTNDTKGYRLGDEIKMNVILTSSIKKNTSIYKDLCSKFVWYSKSYRNYLTPSSVSKETTDIWKIRLRGDGTCSANIIYLFENCTIAATKKFTFYSYQPISFRKGIYNGNATTRHIYSFQIYGSDSALVVNMGNTNTYTYKDCNTILIGNKNQSNDADFYRLDGLLEAEWCQSIPTA